MLLDGRQVREIFEAAWRDVEEQIFYDLKRYQSQRPDLLNQLDVLTKVKERLDARIEYPADN
jgi:ppGpp synthetase/RelA/SpoT-type nucleotidyltranferase